MDLLANYKEDLRSYLSKECNDLKKAISHQAGQFLQDTSDEVLNSFVNYHHRLINSDHKIATSLDELRKRSLIMTKDFYEALLGSISQVQSADPADQVEKCAEEMVEKLSESPARDDDLTKYLSDLAFKAKTKINPTPAPASSVSGLSFDSYAYNTQRSQIK